MTSTAPSRRTVPPEIIAAVLLLVVPFWEDAYFHRLPLARPETLTIMVALALVGAAIGWATSRTTSPWLRTVLTAPLLLVSLDLFTDFYQHWAWVALAVLLLTRVLHTHIHRVVSVAMLGVGVSTLLAGEREPEALRALDAASTMRSQPSRDRPPLVHLVLDEHTSVGAIPASRADSASLRAELLSFYVSHGFRIYTHAYSQYHLTANAIPNALNFTADTTHFGWVGGASARFPAALQHNAYFGRLAQSGYAIRSYAPGFLDYCRAAEATPTFCYQTPANSGVNVAAMPMSTTWKTKLLLLDWLERKGTQVYVASRVYGSRVRPLALRLGVTLPEWTWHSYPLGPASALAVFDTLVDDIAHLPALRGTAFFAHALLPHAPYVFDANCAVTDGVFRVPLSEVPAEVRTTARLVRYPKYREQVRCATRQVARVLETLASRGAPDAVVVVHGDHGPRIAGPISAKAGPLTLGDFEDGYATLFAVRAPGVAAGVDSTVVPLRALLQALSAQDFSGISSQPDSAPFIMRLRPGRPAQLWRERLPAGWGTDTP